MPIRLLRWIAHSVSCPTTSKRGRLVDSMNSAGKEILSRSTRQLMQFSRKVRAPLLALPMSGSSARTPMERDVIGGSNVIQYFAITATWADDKELALQQLETGLRAPVASLLLSYGGLKLLPYWDPLRGDPRFEKIVQSLSPKEAGK